MHKLVSRIIRNLSKPYLLPSKIVGKLQWFYAGLNYNESKYIDEQVERFSKLGLNYSDTQSELDSFYLSNEDCKAEISSCHHNLFVALSKKYKFKRILEIGTHSGVNAILLSSLFPEATITTIDLPDNHPIFLNTYNRDPIQSVEFIKKRDELLKGVKNVKFVKMNSLNLTFIDEKFDLIWVDGAHGYPVVGIDIINSLRLVNNSGFVVCDDVYKHVRKSDKMYCSTASYETISELSDAKIVDYSLILKRTVAPWGHPIMRKYIAILRKNSNNS